MADNIDNRVVSMKFDNAQFQQGVSSTVSSLDKLKASLKFNGAGKGINDLQQGVNRFSLSNMEGGITHVSKSFLALSTVGITALANITSRAVNAGIQITKSFTTSPIKDGLKEYETTLNSIQTILANTGLKGDAGLTQVNAALSDLNHYSDLTIYNFSEMARNIGTFTAAGVKLGPATQAIKGIANLAAVSGSSADQASTAMYQLSQALASGSVKLQDWNSVVNAGMGGKVFQDALKETARNHGVAVDQIIKKEGSFRQSLRTGWLSSDILTETLNNFTGDVTASQLKQMGYTDKQIKGILAMGKTAKDAATKVKTVSQLINTLQEAAGSGWAQTWQLIFGNFDEAKTLFTNVNNVLSGMINSSSRARNKLLGDWSKLGGRKIGIMGIEQAFKDLIAFLKPIRAAFRDIFPKKTAQDLVSMTMGFLNFMKAIAPSAKTVINLHKTFRGLFAALDIGIQILKGVAGFFVDIAKSAGVGGGGFLSFTAKIGDFITSVDQALKKGQGITKFFDGLVTFITPVLDMLQKVSAYLGALFSSIDISPGNAAEQTLGRVNDRLSTFSGLAGVISRVWQKVIGVFARAGQVVQPIVDGIAKLFSGLPEAISKSMSNGNFNAVLDLINTSLLGGITLLISRFLKNGLNVNLGGGLTQQLSGIFGTLTGTLKAMQTQIKAKTLLEIAGAIALLTASVVVLSLIDSAALTKALTGMAAAFAELMAAMAVLTKISGAAGFAKIPIIAASMVLLSTAILILSGAVKILSSMSWEELSKGLIGVGVLLGALAAASIVFSANKGGLIAAGLAMIGIATGIDMLTIAVKALSMMSWADIGKGLAGVAGALLAVGLAMRAMPANLPITAAGLVLVGIGLSSIVGAIKLMSLLSWKDMAKGLVGISASLVAIAIAMNLMPATLPITAAGLILVGIALGEIAAVAKIFASMSWKELGKAAAGLAGALLIIAGGMALMSGALPGAAALLVVSAALAVLTPVLVTLGAQSWESLLKGLLALAGAFTVLGVAAALLTPVIPGMIGLGVALVAVGAGLALAGAGAFLFATAFATVAAVGTAGVSVLVGVLNAVIAAIPGVIKAFGEGVVLFAGVIATSGPVLVKAFVTVLDSLITAIIHLLPRIGTLINKLVGTVINIISTNIPKIYRAAEHIIISILSGIRDNIGKIVTVAVSIITNFLRAIGQQAPKIVDAAAKMLIDFINGISDAIDANSYALGQAGERLAISIIEGMVKGIMGGVSSVIDAVKGVAGSAIDAAKKKLHINSPSKDFIKIGSSINEGFVVGLVGGRHQVRSAINDFTDLLRKSVTDSSTEIKKQQEQLKKLKSSGADATAIRKAEAALRAARTEHTRSGEALDLLSHHMKKQKQQLDELGKQYDKVHAKLTKAEQKLADAKKASKDAAASVTATFSQTADISSTTQLGSYEEKIKKQTADTVKFKNSLAQLRKMGLDTATYNKLLAEGVSIQPFVDQILASGPEGIKKLNNLDKGLATAAKSLGTQTSKDLYQAGIDSAQGLVDGLAHSQKKIENQMAKIAKAMVKAIKHELGIKSPSREGIEIGKFMVAGIAKGLDSSGDADRAAKAVAERTAKALRLSMGNAHDLIAGDLNLQPVIKPVLDLTNLQKESGKLDKLMLDRNMTATTSLSQANSISRLTEAISKAKLDTTTQPVAPREVNFHQTNISPKPLSPVVIYRQTRNQLSLAKEALKES